MEHAEDLGITVVSFVRSLNFEFGSHQIRLTFS
jgi:formate dehydrogenase assembly factor FdhD